MFGIGGGFKDLIGNLTGQSQADAQAKQARDMINQRTGQALNELTPEAMQAIMGMFMNKYMAMLAPQMMNAKQGLAASLGRGGGSQFGLGTQLSAGIPAQFSNQALQEAMRSAMGLAGQRANIIAQRPVVTDTGRNWLGDIADYALQFYTGGMASTGETKQGSRTY